MLHKMVVMRVLETMEITPSVVYPIEHHPEPEDVD